MQAWSHLYVAGRMQKPVTPLSDLEPGAPLARAQRANLHGALAAALLLLPERFTTRQLMEAVVSLSYRGDVRYAVQPASIRACMHSPVEPQARLPWQFRPHRAVFGTTLPFDVLRVYCRQWFAEDPKKVPRIVDGSMQGLVDMYVPLMQVREGAVPQAHQGWGL